MKQLFKSRLFLIAGAIAAFLILFGAYQLYQNSKTDGLNSGWIEVSHCQVKNDDWRIYACRGNYTSNAGMMYRDNTSVIVTAREPRGGDIVADVYPSAFHTIMNADYFVTGKERSSVVYNLPWLAMILIGLLLPFGVGLYRVGGRSTLK